ncbi:MAG: hypothetical protein DMF86_22040 [Acidobacteria bacterium]|nr:MAG: hypothetical protein DMF86_22040 [Acidobacteriota bacterium]
MKVALKHIRVVVGKIPRILRAIIEGAITLQSDMELIASGGADLSATARRSHADVVIVAEEMYEGDPAHRQVLVDNPQLKLFVVTDDGRAAHMLEFRRLPVADVSPQGLVEAIRDAVGTGARPQAE